MATDYRSGQGMIGGWLFSEGSGTTVADASGNSVTGNNVPGWSSTVPTGYSNYSASYNGTAGIDFSNNATLRIQKPLSFVAWVKVSSASTQYDILGGNNAQSYFYFFINSSNRLQVHKRNAVDMGTSSGAIGTNFAHVAFTYDASGNYVFYINGSASGSGTSSQTFTYADGVYLGQQSSSSAFFSGLIAEPAMFNVALSSTQVNEIMNNGLAGTYGGSPASQFLTTNSRMW